jgi:hypothetical protein
MKIIKAIKNLAILFFAVLAIALWSCGGNNQSHEGHDHEHSDTMETSMHGEGKEYTSAYICPMHCEGSGGDEAGSCPKCGMTYVTQADHVMDGHKH